MSTVEVFWKHCRKREKLLIMSYFSFSYIIFYQFREFSPNFVKFEIVVCKLSIWKCLHFVVWERVNKPGKGSRNPFLNNTVFNDPEIKRPFENNVGIQKKYWWPSFSPFSTMLLSFLKKFSKAFLLSCIKSVPCDKILDLTKLKAFADDKNVTQILEFVWER